MLFSSGLTASLSQGDELPGMWLCRFLIFLEKNGRRWKDGRRRRKKRRRINIFFEINISKI